MQQFIGIQYPAQSLPGANNGAALSIRRIHELRAVRFIRRRIATVRLGFAGVAVLSFFFAHSLAAQVPGFIEHEGDLAGPNANFTGTGQFKFSIINPGSGNAFWKNGDNSATLATNGGPITEPSTSVPLNVTAGSYGIYLGANGTKPVPYAVFSHPGLNVRVWFSPSGAAGTFVVQPDAPIPASGYSMSIPDGTITAPKLASGVVTTAKLAPGAVTSAKIASNSITGDRIASATLTANNFHTTVPPAAGKVLAFDGSNLIWGTGTGSSVFSLNGTNAYYNGGNIGIGSSQPVSKLDIIGAQDALRIAGYQPFLTLLDSNASNARGRIQSVNGDVDVFTESYLSGANSFSFLKVANNGNVGIGSSQPIGKLEVVGQDALRLVGYGPFLTLFDSGTGYARGRIQSVGGDVDLFTESYLNGANSISFLKLANNGNVGIGSSQPAGKLEVVSQDALRLIGYQPFLTLLDSNAGYARGRIQSVAGGMTFETENFVNGSSPNAFAALGSDGVFSVKAVTIRGGADLAEPFLMNEQELAKGSVVVIDRDHPGRLKRSTTAYDRHVAGIVSGANGLNPGIALHQDGMVEGGQEVALTGRVYVRANTSGGEIAPGDLLTTSDIPGEAMKAADDHPAAGAILGKAMTSLEDPSGTVLVLVSLQ